MWRRHTAAVSAKRALSRTARVPLAPDAELVRLTDVAGFDESLAQMIRLEHDNFAHPFADPADEGGD
jgi:hypothetical protein